MLQIKQFLSKMPRICSFNISATMLYTAKYVLILLFQGVSDGSSKQIMSRETLNWEKKFGFPHLIFECVCIGQANADAFFQTDDRRS